MRRRILPLLFVPAVAAWAAPPSLSFVKDVMPILNKTSCTSGPCHGGAKGKNGFKLSLRGYDPEFDYRAIVHEMQGRRLNRQVPGCPDRGVEPGPAEVGADAEAPQEGR